jgi:2-O-A-mannosyl-D-glycerate-specific PTS system IIC component
MNLLALTHPDLVFINPPHRSPEALIRWLAEPLARRKIISNEETFIQSVLQRESEGPTALGEALAVPHGKTEAVQQAAFCLALFDDPICWPGLDGDEEVRMVFLLAIPPAEAGSTHMQLLTTLTCLLTEDRVRERLLAARTRKRRCPLCVLKNLKTGQYPERSFSSRWCWAVSLPQPFCRRD